MVAIGSKDDVVLLLFIGEEIEVGTVALTLKYPPSLVHIRRHIEVILCVTEDTCLTVFGTEAELVATQVEVDRHV